MTSTRCAMMTRLCQLIDVLLCTSKKYDILESNIISCTLPSFSGITMEGWGLETSSLSGKYDVLFSYIYTNTTKLLFYLSYLVHLG